MIKVAAVFTLVLSAAVSLAEPPRVAVVRVADVFRQLESTVQATVETKAKQAEINRDGRLATYNQLYSDLQARRKALDDKQAPLDDETRKRLARGSSLKLQEAKSVMDDFEAFRAERNREIDTEMVAGMKQRLALIQATAEKFAKQAGYDWVLDASGNTNTGVPLLLYAKKANDLTEQVLAELGKAEGLGQAPDSAGHPAPPPPPSPSSDGQTTQQKR